ncbi:MAG: glycoside hydrolase family 1 protein [Candidatus Omnitrophica bacterium]|nr:glycoside hydrolase family 1 protein [Candidatus Omnitrophota bacterium]
MIEFPSNFLWGAATSAYQVEGNNTHSDWWHWEKETGKENSGSACRHYELYARDFDLAQNLHHNTHRFSIEWGRIEPEEGKFSRDELNHYLDVILTLRSRNIEPMVTLHHFTNPDWFSTSIGWENNISNAYFLRYCDFVVRALAKHIRYWITINEPTIYLSHAYILGVWPPQKKSYTKAKAVADNLASAHAGTFRRIHAIYKESGLPRPAVGIAQHMQAFVPCTPAIKNRLAAYMRNKWYNFGLLDKLTREGTLDFIGINYYSRQLVDLKKWGLNNLAKDICQQNHHPLKRNSLGWEIYPDGLYDLLLELKKYRLPVIITENGICTGDDGLRWKYIYAHLNSIHRALENGVPVTGYLYWSLLDNFEWDKGFAPRFGLIDIDYTSYTRTVRESAVKFGQTCKTGILE